MVKETGDLAKEITRLAAEGAGYVGGGRNGAFKVALLARRSPGTTDYTFLDDDKAAQGFDKLVAAGYSYQGMMKGDLHCESEEMVSQKLVFARDAASPARRYKLLSLPEPKPGRPTPAALSELQRLAGENFSQGHLYARAPRIFEKQTEARVSQINRRRFWAAAAEVVMRRVLGPEW